MKRPVQLLLLGLCLLPGLAKGESPPLKESLIAAGKAFRLDHEAGKTGALDRLMAEIESLGQAHPDKREPWELLESVADWVKASAEKKQAYTRLAKLDAKRYPKLVKLANEELAWLEKLAKPIELKFTATDGRKVDVAKLRGKVVLIYFCASWCPPCVHEYPNLKSVYDRYHKKGFEIVGISADKTRAQFDLYSKRKKIPWPQHYEDNAWEGSFMKQFRVEYIPRLFLLDHTGRVAAQDTRKNLEEKVRELLAKRPSG